MAGLCKKLRLHAEVDGSETEAGSSGRVTVRYVTVGRSTRTVDLVITPPQSSTCTLYQVIMYSVLAKTPEPQGDLT
jgi:hypothetical protein